MKLLIVFAAVVVCAMASLDRMADTWKWCQEDTGVTDEDIGKIVVEREVKTLPAKRWMACMMTKMEILNGNWFNGLGAANGICLVLGADSSNTAMMATCKEIAASCEVKLDPYKNRTKEENAGHTFYCLKKEFIERGLRIPLN